ADCRWRERSTSIQNWSQSSRYLASPRTSCHNSLLLLFFFFNNTATTEIYTLSLHDALPIYGRLRRVRRPGCAHVVRVHDEHARTDRKSTRLNSSHDQISYAVFCLKKKKKHIIHSFYAKTYIAMYSEPPSARHNALSDCTCET